MTDWQIEHLERLTAVGKQLDDLTAEGGNLNVATDLRGKINRMMFLTKTGHSCKIHLLEMEVEHLAIKDIKDYL